MDQRKNQLLKLVIENHIKTAQPIGSKFLVANSDLKVSDATVRNEMRDLEESGFLTHPHTSAGRVPTQQGYKYYVENLMEMKKIDKKEIKDIQVILDREEEKKQNVKLIAKYVAEKVKSAVIIAFGVDFVYYTGIANLFSQPEFHNISHTVNISSIFDNLEQHIEELFDILNEKDLEVLIGSENPLGNACSLVGTSFENNIFSVLGPMRMDYESAIPMVSFISEII